MALSDPDLWRRLEGFEVSPPDAVFSFTRRLARENGWSFDFARRVFAEYRRFVYLCVVAGREMTPSDAVDQAWHLHLTYTRSYWQTLCRGVLGRPLHHEPTRGGAAERDRFEANYLATLGAYVREFAELPPDDIWPDAEARFAAPAWRRIDPREHLVIDRRRLARAVEIAMLLLVLPPVLVACTLIETGPDGWRPTTTAVWLGVLVVGVPAVIGLQRAFLNPSCREPRRRGWFGIELGCSDGDGGCGGCSD